MNFPDTGFDVDHKNHPPRTEHKVDNRKSNLEIVTRSENLMNLSLRKDNKSGRHGIWWDESRKNWQAYISVNGQKIRLGRFKNKEDAIIARENAEIKYFGKRRYAANN